MEPLLATLSHQPSHHRVSSEVFSLICSIGRTLVQGNGKVSKEQTKGSCSCHCAVLRIFFRLLMCIFKLSEEMHNDLLETREVPTAWETPIARQIARRSFMNAITSHGNISSVMLIRMNCRCFSKLCRLLVTEGGLRGSWNIKVDEMVSMFLYTIAHNEKN
ncbi:hypothetical protein LINPERPRIM_LOCUS11241, partial [Linum perenne]